MPLYSYKCDCGNRVDKLRSMDRRNDPVECPECGGNCAKQMCRPNIKIDMSGMEYFGDPRHVDDKRRKAGIAT